MNVSRAHLVSLTDRRVVAIDRHAVAIQASLIAGTAFQGTKLPLTIWFLAIYLISQAKTGLSGSYHAFDFRKYAARYLAAFCYRFNRRFDLRTLH